MNILEILVGAVITMIVGSVWYSPILFEKLWMKTLGKSKKELHKGNMGRKYVLMFLMALIMSYVLLYIIQFLRVATLGSGIVTGILIWFGFVITTSLGDYLFSGRPMKLYAINVGYYLVVFILLGGLFGVWQ